MTPPHKEFEEKLGEALVAAMDGLTLAQGYHMSPADHVRRLAPIIAQAMRDAMYGSYWCAVTHGHAPKLEAGETLALATLRGSR